jgi:PAS domain S-box-containing protein
MKNSHSTETGAQEQSRYIVNLIKRVSQPMIATSADRRLLHWNAAFTKLTGYSNKELSDPIISAGLTAPEWHDSETKALEKLQQTGKSQTFQKEYIRKDGSRVPVEILIYQLIEDNGKVQYYIGLITDITEHKQLEETLQKSERHYRVLVENAIEGIVVIQDGEIKFVNPIVSMATGYSSEEILSMSLNDLLCPDNEKTTLESISKVVAPGTMLMVPLLKIRTKSGGTRLIESTIVPVIWDDRPANLNLLRDITDRYEAEDTLRRSEKKYRSILEDIKEGYWETDLAGNFTFFSDPICHLLGYPEKEMMGMNYRTFTGAQDVDKVYKAFNRVFRTGKPIRNMQYEIILKGGRKRLAETSVFPMANDKGETIGFRGVSHDITQRKKMEEALRHSEERYRTILDEMQEGYFEVDLAGNYTYTNEANCRNLGYSLEELIGTNYRLTVVAKDIDKVYQAFNQVYSTGQPCKDITFNVVGKDGGIGVTEISASPLRNEKGAIVGFRGIGRDITERKAMEETLRRAEERYRTVLEDMEEAYYELDLAGNFTFFNDAMCNQLGYSREELTGMNYKVYTPSKQIPKLREAWNKVYRTGETLKFFPIERLRKDGTLVFAESSAFTLRNEKGEIIGFRGIVRDITERIKGEEAIKRSEERYRTIMDEMHDDYFETDLAGNFTFVNDALCRSLGGSADELIGSGYKDRTAGNDIKKVYEAFNQIFRTGEPIRNLNFKFIRSDSSSGIAEMSALPIRNQKGEIIGFRGISHDVTERKQMEETLRKSEERYRTILDDMEEAYFEMDLNGNYTYFNDALCSHLGYSADELMGMNYRVYVPPDKVDHAFEIFNHIYRTGETVKVVDVVQVRKDGRQIFVELSASPLRNENNEIIGFRGIFRDVTERSAAQEALRQSEERYRTVLDDMEEGYYETDLAGNYTFFNDVICKKLGYSREELMGKNFQVHTDPEDVEKISDAYYKLYTTGKPLKWFSPAQIRKDGTRIFAEDSVSLLRNEKGEIIGFRGVSRDITERKRMEEALRLSEERYRTLLDEMDTPYYEDDLAGNFTFVNDAMCRAMGYSKEELIGMNYKVYTPPEQVTEVFQAYSQVYRTGKTTNVFARETIHKNGRVFPVETSILPLKDDKGEIIGFRGISRDITERKKAEEEKRQLERKAQLASRLASVGELASGVAHEINNPLTGVIGYAHLLLSRKDISRDVRRDLEIINEGSQRVAGIVKKLLAFARQTKPEHRYVNINELIRNTLDLRAYELSANNIKVTLQLNRDIPLTIADPGQLQQVFLNLIINAETEMKSASDRGKLTIKTEKINNTLRITFKDTGPGIPEENLETIFDPFFTTREVGQGTGLGLSVCHGIITEHNGKIWAESEWGKGASFIVELPLTTEEGQGESSEPVVEESEKIAKAVKILVVDDEPVIRQFISQVLGEQGHRVETVDNAAAALKMVKAKRYRLILLDIKMPGMSGVDLYKQFQKIAPSLTKRVVFITGDVMGKRTISFLNKTKTPYLMKPFDAKELKAEINRILAKK